MKTKTKTTTKPKPRSKAAKIQLLKRSAAGKAVHHRRRIREHAKHHLRITFIVLVAVLALGGLAAIRANNLVPPPGDQANVDVYIRAAQAAAQRDREAIAANVANTPKPPDQIGSASWYALGLRNPDALTCASTTFPRGTYLRVKDLRNSAEVTCLVDDYGPEAGTKRVIDLSRGSYSALEGLGSGTMPVEIWVVPGP